MASWGTQQNQGNSAPNWYVDLSTRERGGDGNVANNVIYRRPNHPAAAENLEATERGWERVIRYTDSSGTVRIKREIVVVQHDLANTLAYGTSNSVTANVSGPVITDIRWRDANTALYANGQAVDSSIAYAAGQTEIAIVVTFSEPVYVDTHTGFIPYISIDSTPSMPQPGRAVLTSGNGTNKLVFANTMNWLGGALVEDDVLNLVDSHTFITGTHDSVGTPWVSDGIYGLQANTGYGRNANTPYPELKRYANLSSRGVKSPTEYDTLTLAVDAGTKTVGE
tara:strand:- start:143 stop:985 length:843 start_codon:yes stop_codon:yes gene_type:complete